jgi:peptide/nickel transport system substrate-binding protein
MLRRIFLFLAIISIFLTAIGCRGTNNNGAVTIANSEGITALDTITAPTSTAADERLRNLIHNSLLKKSDKFEYVGDLSNDPKIESDNLTVTFNLRNGIKFHNGKEFTSSDAKYTIDTLMKIGGYKSGTFFDVTPNPQDEKNPIKEPRLTLIETPDAKTLVIKVKRPSLVNQLFADLVAIPMIPEGSIEQQKTAPVGTGPFKFVSFDQVNNLVQLAANPEYFEGSPKIPYVNIKKIEDASALQAELQTGRVDLAPNPTNISSDTANSLSKVPNLQVVYSNGSNIRYIGFNVSQAPLNNAKLRQAIAYAIDREKIIKELLGGNARLSNSILPPECWAYSENVKYNYNPEKAKQLIQESGYKGEQLKLLIPSGTQAVTQYSTVIQESLKAVGINLELEPLESKTLLEQLNKGQFQMNTSIWAGGNQDPIFLKDLFASGESPDKKKNGRNRSRYENTVFDKIVQEAIDSTDKTKAKEFYGKAQDIVANELPLLPLWYPSNMVIATKRMGNININASGDWSFVKDVTVQ